MIEKLYIITYKRVGNQVTYDALPDKWKEKAVLVVHPDEQHPGYPTLPCPVQGNVAEVRKWVAEHARGTRYGMLDDDITFMRCRRDPEGKEVPWNRDITDSEFDEMMLQFDEWMDDGFVHNGLDVTWSPPCTHMDAKFCFRIAAATFYSDKLPVDEIDWTGLSTSEDYYVNLQLLTKGYPSMVFEKFRIATAATQVKGGCEDFRTLESHNSDMRALQAAFPKFVRLREKLMKGGMWKGQVRLACTISWKQAYKSSQVNKQVNSLDWAV